VSAPHAGHDTHTASTAVGNFVQIFDVRDDVPDAGHDGVRDAGAMLFLLSGL
jgi:hypothetical protein